MLNSPLRYPGGKAKLFPFLSSLISLNCLFGRNYCEPYAGGAGLALRLLSTGFVKSVSINDIDPAINAFWVAATKYNAELCEKILTARLDIDEWHIQKGVYSKCDASDIVGLAFATFYLNRTNRSGIIAGAGPVGGYEQLGLWKLDARFDREKQAASVSALTRYSPQISVFAEDAVEFSSRMLDNTDNFLYLDPPYYIKGQKLYRNYYTSDDHKIISDLLREKRSKFWLLSYDDVPQIRDLYFEFAPLSYELSYSAGRAGAGREVMYASDAVRTFSSDGLRTVA